VKTRTFKTLRYATILQEVGFTKEQAEVSVNMLVEVTEDKLASKQDLQDLRIELKAEMREIRHDMVQMESRITIKVGTMFAAAIAILTALQKNV
jgi:hypothetical protein